MRYSITEDVSFEEATPRGLLRVAFKAGEVEVEPGSDEQYAIEYVLIPNELAAPAAPKAKAKAKVVDPPADPADKPDAASAVDEAKE